MGTSTSKFMCLYLPAQSGKTKKIEELITAYKKIHECINIIISSNNILLVKQTETRMKTDLATESGDGANDAVIKSGVFSWTSGDKCSNISPRELKDRILEEEVEMAVVCAHPKRLEYLSEMLRMLAASKFFRNRKIYIWIDEADKSIKLWQKYDNLVELPAIHQVTLISATFKSVFAKYGRLQVLGFYKTHPDCYRRLKDSVKIEENLVTSDASEYVKHVVLKNREKLTRPGSRGFIPGDTRKNSHDAIADFLHNELGFVVIIINGDRKEIMVPGSDKIDLRCYLTVSDTETPVEFNKQLAKIYKENNWSRFPLAITGFYCVQRGVTFQCLPSDQHDGFLFDYGIIPPIASEEEAYQAMARLFGNVGNSPHYKPVEIYTNSAMFNKAEKQEEQAVNLPRMVAEQGLVTVGAKEVKDAQNFEADAEWDFFQGEFDTLDAANKFLKCNGGRGNSEKTLSKDKQGAFFKSSTSGESTILHYDTVKKEMAGWSKLSNLNANTKKATARMYICYKNLEDPASIVYICRCAKRKIPLE